MLPLLLWLRKFQGLWVLWDRRRRQRLQIYTRNMLSLLNDQIYTSYKSQYYTYNKHRSTSSWKFLPGLSLHEYIMLSSNEAVPTSLIETVLRWTHTPVHVFASGVGISVGYIYTNGIIKSNSMWILIFTCHIPLLRVTTNWYPHKLFINAPSLIIYEMQLFLVLSIPFVEKQL